MHRISLSVVVALLSCLLMAAADDDLPDLDKIAERHRAILNSIRSGRITYIEERTPGTTDLEKSRRYYRSELEEIIEKWKAAGADSKSLGHWQSELDNITNTAARHLVTSTVRRRINCVFEKNLNTVREETVDLRDIEGLLDRYGVEEDAASHDQSMSTQVTRDAQKSLSAKFQMLFVLSPENAELVIEPLSRDSFFTEARKPAAEGGDENIESVKYHRDPASPNLIVEEVVNLPEYEERFLVVKDGATTEVTLPLEEPLVQKTVTVLDESRDYRVLSRSVFENNRLHRKYAYEYTDDDSHCLPSKTSVTTYREDGSIMRTTTTHLESVELNVEIGADELQLNVPSGTFTVDHRGGKPVTIPPESREEVIEQLDNILEGVPAEEVEAPDPVEAVEEPAIEGAEAPAPTQEAREDDGGGSIMAIGIAFIVIAAIIAVVLWARRRQN